MLVFTFWEACTVSIINNIANLGQLLQRRGEYHQIVVPKSSNSRQVSGIVTAGRVTVLSASAKFSSEPVTSHLPPQSSQPDFQLRNILH
jgi:hypothetical protein